MSNLNLTYSTNTSSTGIRGRSISSARNHHIVIDDSGGEELGAGELFLGAIGACAVNMIGRNAASEGFPLEWIEADVDAYRDGEKAEGDLAIFDRINVNIRIWGLDDVQADMMVATWKRR
ncbi:MAG: OsmC family protein [Dehalococcoidia bacterium]|nr:OsmC family protein [Dehalococcoidia bacterium]